MPNEDDRPWDRNRRDDHDDRPQRREDEDHAADDEDRPRRRRRPSRPAPAGGMATAGLVLGVLSICGGPLLGIPAVICAAISLGRAKTGKGMAGLVTGVIGTTLTPLLLIGLLLPAVAKVREAASRMADQNNLKQMALAAYNDPQMIGDLNGPYAYDDRGDVSTGLSFRVSLLPQMGYNGIHQRFDLSQSWDSAKNRPLSDTTIKEYNTPFDPAPGPNTPYRAFYGGGALFDEDGKPVPIRSITDGASNTILFIHAAERVPWANPQELRYDPTGPLPAFGSPGMSGGTNVAMADGSVRVLRKDTPERTVRALITRAGGEQIPADW